MPYGTVNADVIQTSTSGGILGAGDASAMKNRIINGAMVIDQRNAGASVATTATAAAIFTVDRFFYLVSQASKFTIQQNAGGITPPAGFSNYLGMTSTSSYSASSSDYFWIEQSIEGFNTADLNFGTINAKTVTLSFWVYSSLTGNWSGSLCNSAQNYSYPFTVTVPTANTWTQVSVTITGPTAGTWIGATNGNGLRVRFDMGSGSTYRGTAGVWTGSQLLGATGANSLVETNGATFYITGVQLEVGSSATGFEYRQYGQELALCQRYYQTSYPYGTAIQAATGVTDGVSFISINTSDSSNGGTLPVTMRATPTFAVYSTLGGVGSPSARDNTSGLSITGITLNGGTTTNLPRLSKTAGLPVTGGSSSAQYTASAEL